MVLYLIGIVGGDFLVCLINILLFKQNPEFSWVYLLIAGILGAIAVIAIDGVIALFVRRCLPNKWFTHEVAFHDASKKECKFYEKIGIKVWKDHVLELGMFTAFSKKNISNPDAEYLERFILENNYGYWCHLADAIGGFLLILCYPKALMLPMALPICIINFILNMMPFMILRYNNSRLKRIHTVLTKKAARGN